MGVESMSWIWGIVRSISSRKFTLGDSREIGSLQDLECSPWCLKGPSLAVLANWDYGFLKYSLLLDVRYC